LRVSPTTTDMGGRWVMLKDLGMAREVPFSSDPTRG
jgi:hypothetical protein